MLLCLTAAAALAGCATPPPPLPKSVTEYADSRKADPHGYPRYVILQHNLQRVLDENLPEAQRVASLKLVTRLGEENPEATSELAGVLAQPNAPEALQQAVLEFLLRKDYPDLAGVVVRILPAVKPGSGLREAILDWLTRHGGPAVLAEVVKLWAQEPSATGPNEPRFRQIVERVSGKTWDKALLEGLNARDFFARGSAMEILARRIPEADLRGRIKLMRAKTDAAVALHAMLDRFDYLPLTRSELVAVVMVYLTQRDMIPDSARLCHTWQEDYGYRFNARDFYLVSRLVRDPLRDDLRRTQLVLELAQAMAKREHVPFRPVPGKTGGTDRFGRQVDGLAITDLWNLYLLNEMLGRSRVQIALRVLADRDRADRSQAWGGLVFYENGRAEAKLYPPDPAGSTDRTYAPSPRATREGRDALCLFHAHFEKVYNAPRAGPDPEELRAAARGNYYGLVLTSVSESTFCAHYYSPTGRVVSLGKFPFRK